MYFCLKYEDMKIIYLLIVSIFFLGCEKYETISEPSVAGRWKFTDYYITPVKIISGLVINEDSDTICINSFSKQTLSGGKIKLEQYYNETTAERRFIKNKTIWEFDGPSQSTIFPLLINEKNDDVWANFKKPYLEREYVDLLIQNERLGVSTEYSFFTSGLAQNYSKKLTLTSPVISTDLYFSNGGSEKTIDVIITLIFTRN
jgi:hypothetical protein